jgi:hypothetical protein
MPRLSETPTLLSAGGAREAINGGGSEISRAVTSVVAAALLT